MKIQSKTKIYRASALIKVDEMQCSNASLDPILAA
jgi:hypothetical protein